jgi:hypothetical protein
VNIGRLRGLRQLLEDVVEHGSRAVERVQKETARRPFAIVEAIPAIGAPARGIHEIYDASVGGVHIAIRMVNRAVGATLEAALDTVEQVTESQKDATPPAAATPPLTHSEGGDATE